jgi:uncharacterized protein YdhG (YjbR/CyaY superfamily)
LRRKFASMDEYIGSYPSDVAKVLQQVRRAIRQAAPNAQEGIGYNIPMFSQDGYLVYFAAFKDHISLYPTMSGIRAFEKELFPYLGKKTKGTVQFPIDKKIPFDLVKKIVRFRVKENTGRAGKITRKGRTTK